MLNKIYIKHIYNIFLQRFIYTTLIFSSLIFILNILEELKFFTNIGISNISLPILLTVLNLPSLLFEIFPFIILITTQFFFIKFQNNSEILIFRNNGINNLKIISYICLLVFFIGFFIITFFHFLSSNMKHLYLEFKNKYTQDNKYLAVINENGLWIKDQIDNEVIIIHSEKINSYTLENLFITVYDSDFQNKKNIIAKKAVITEKNWKINDGLVLDDFGKKESFSSINFKTNFDYERINNLFSNLESLNILELYNQRKDFMNVGLTVSDIDIKINQIFSVPISLIIFTILSSILMLNIRHKNSKTFVLISGILLSVIIYYIYYFFGLLGSNNKLPILVAIWMPNLILFLSCLIGIVNINEK